MKFFVKLLIVVGILAGIAALAYPPIARSIEERSRPRWRTAKIERGTITRKVNATGTVRPVKKVQIGSFVSGPILDLYVEFNQEVKAGELLARIDPRLFAANVARDLATLETRKAEVNRVKALLQQAKNAEARAAALRERNVDFIAESELDQVKFNCLSLEAQLVIAKASIEQAQATLTNSEANLEYCNIRSPEDGMIIDRKVEPGQTLAAQFQTPELFVVGVGMREKMHIFADVDESEIGLIRDAAERKQPVTFTVTAYPKDEFKGLIEEVRFSSAELQNVVTYPVVVGCPNPDLKLLPGMTADLSFQIRKQKKVLRIPKAALRFFPENKAHVHPDYHFLIDGKTESNLKAENGEEEENEDDEEVKNEDIAESGEEKTDESDSEKDDGKKSKKKPQKKHVWIVDGELLKAVEIKIGISDSRYSELVIDATGSLDEGTEIVTRQKAAGEL